MSLNELQVRLRQFTDARDWEQFHTIRNLILALVGEVGELAESVQWLGEIDKDYFKNNPEKFESFKDEIADIFIYLVRIADVSEIDLLQAASDKMKKNESRYTVKNSKGNAEKR